MYWGKIFRCMLTAVCCATFFSAKSETMAAEVAIVAIVDGTPITSYDLKQRTILAKRLLQTSGVKMSEDKIQENVLSEMIGDTLKIAEAKKFNVFAEKEEIDDAKKRMEDYLGLGEEGYKKLIKELGIDEKIVNDQIRADVTWMKFVYTVLRSYVRVSGSELEMFVDDFKNSNHFVYDLVPLVVKDEMKNRNDMEKIRQIKDCEEFKMFALENGKDGSGTMFSIRDDQMDKSMLKFIDGTSVGKSVMMKNGNGDENVFFVCGKNPYQIEISDEKKAELKMNIYREKLDAFANKYFEKMKNSAFIDVKK